jgi:hypothetical protein
MLLTYYQGVNHHVKNYPIVVTCAQSVQEQRLQSDHITLQRSVTDVLRMRILLV